MDSYDQVFLFYKSFSLEYLEYNFGNISLFLNFYNKLVKIFIIKITTVKPTNPIKKYKGFPFSFSGITSRTTVYRITPEINENKI